ncbi:sensor histidine kinase [Phaeodactylibacter sp.]|jgi:sensor histidine kinase YesM|uniref:sensor histidine kinase n=1 Tax=Phaeodactylibacter sp. TaxID=1940289 RepID=UPI0025E8E248|nr:sensor histidine kinase [Phaeodactylibacter sp.]MCI4647701.1 histidine kinase [Phaeodactylibacter sp.]MCI5091481.1 histidine kinase [Phaeodactylibacter sp.]
MKITHAQDRLYEALRRDLVQHLVFGAVVLIVVFCFFAVHAWYQGKAELLDTFGYQREAFWKVFREALGYTLMMGVPVYFNLFFVYQGRLQDFLTRGINDRKWVKNGSFYLFLLLSLITAVVFSFIYAPVMHAAFDIIEQQWYELVIAILVFILCTTGISYTKEAIERSRELERKERLDIIRRRREAEQQLNFIKRQIRPHFLFNTLANLQILARRKSEGLPDLIGELSRLLRHLVYQTNERLVPLQDELRFIRSYVELQRLQLGAHTLLDYREEGQVPDNARIAPMILLLFVENCFKHYNSRGAGEKLIQIHFEIKEGWLEACIRNTFKPHARNEGTVEGQKAKSGIGLSAALENLELVYGGRYLLEVDKSAPYYTINLKIPVL